MIFGISGCCRKSELHAIQVNHLKRQGELLEIIIPDTKNNVPRRFVIDPQFVPIVEKYQSLRPAKAEKENFFLQYRNGKCTVQVIGINTIGNMPKKIAEFLNLKNPKDYMGHSFRRTSATVLADTGATTMDLQRHGGWKSATVAQSYVDDSTEYKKTTAKKISNAILSEVVENSSVIEKQPAKKIKIATSENLPEQECTPEKFIVLNNCSNVTIHYNK